MLLLKNGTLVRWSSGGSTHHGFIIGLCDYDNHGTPNAYAVRYVFLESGEGPARPYSIVDMEAVIPVKKYKKDFFVAGYWSATPDDRVDQWELEKDEHTGHLIVTASRGE